MSLLLTGFSDNPMQSRADFQKAARSLVEPLVPFLERDGAALDLEEGAANFDMRASYLEGVARPFWGLVPLALGGGSFKHWDLFRRALVEGTSPDHPNRWGPVGEVDQRAVEMAAIGFLLALLPEQGWAPLGEQEKDNLAHWLAGLQQREVSANNWKFFTVLVQEGLRKVGRADLVDDKLEKSHLQQLADWYRGDGWYGDGGSGAVDHYGGFAMHFYGMLYAMLKRGQDDPFACLFEERAAAFAEPFSHWFADNGESMIQGRSLTYRFATSAYWGMLAASGLRPMEAGVIKGLWARQIRQWCNRPIFRPDGVLSRGYAYPNLHVCEFYNSPTSPYWAMKAFMPLALDEDSDFWQAEEKPLPERKKICAMPHADSLLQRTDGHAITHFAAPIHTWLQMDKYNKFAYSTLCGFDVMSLQYAHVGIFGDNILALSFDEGANWQMRQRNLDVKVREAELEVRWTSGSQEVTTLIQAGDDGCFTRTHCFELAQSAEVVETGFAVDQWYEEAVRLQFDEQAVMMKGTNALSIIRANDALARTPLDSLRINSNMASPRTRIPGFRLSLEPGSHRISHAFQLKAM
ncbi:DUF2264 domain-containing protein [uncultured Cohaesibacter sp.]|uniref:DUF2264 domain-containing protein n=1 Tax=uncultured Cohaesibacter sp. TaxID=1002546 RepID=UPI00292FCABA|nr:DUF2264 domain-containing protein [uncultured Cohaesibacter sp.]